MEHYRDIAAQKHESVKESDSKMSILTKKNEKLLKEKQNLMLEIASMKQEIENNQKIQNSK